jgi:Ca2+-binding EF-hand superfamily protein
MTLIDFLKRLIVLEVNNERTKDELALLYDFTFIEAFKLLDKDNKGSLEINEILDLLKSEFGITRFNEKEIGLFIQRYDRY